MGLREQAEQDLGTILEDTGDSWPITLTSPDGTVGTLTGLSDDIAQIVDPDTGQAVSGRVASVALRIGHINAELPGKGIPVGIADGAIKPWVVTFDDINGNAFTFKVQKSNPDRVLGLVTCLLETYTP